MGAEGLSEERIGWLAGIAGCADHCALGEGGIGRFQVMAGCVRRCALISLRQLAR
jgi:hypothetical protein